MVTLQALKKSSSLEINAPTLAHPPTESAHASLRPQAGNTFFRCIDRHTPNDSKIGIRRTGRQAQLWQVIPLEVLDPPMGAKRIVLRAGTLSKFQPSWLLHAQPEPAKREAVPVYAAMAATGAEHRQLTDESSASNSGAFRQSADQFGRDHQNPSWC